MDLSPLPVTYQATIPEEYMDDMAHMNVMWYVHLFDRATWRFFASLGMSLDYFDEYDTGAFALEQHTRYLAEVRQEQMVILRTRAIGRSIKRFHFMQFMIIEDSSVLAATTELIGVHIDCATRRSSPLPDHIAGAFDRLIAEHREIDWDPPICGSMHP
jgi:acyl-CoA thioester hydrolase